MPNADVIFQSSDLVHFRVNKLVLVTSSPFFADMFSLPQPLNDTAPDDLPVVHLPEDAEVLNSLFSMLYPVTPEMPHSNDGILALLATATKYDMDVVQTLIRAEISRRGLFSSAGAGVFRVYAVAYSKGLIPEVATAARLTLGHPFTFESLGDALRLFEGQALRDLADFRLRSIRNFSSNWRLFSDCLSGPSKIWVDCPTDGGDGVRRLPTWLQDCLWWKMVDRFGPIRMDRFTETIPTCVQLCDKYSKALRTHVKEDDCHFCMKTDILHGEIFCKEMTDISEKAWNVPTPMSGELGESVGTPSSYVEINSPYPPRSFDGRSGGFRRVTGPCASTPNRTTSPWGSVWNRPQTQIFGPHSGASRSLLYALSIPSSFPFFPRFLFFYIVLFYLLYK